MARGFALAIIAAILLCAAPSMAREMDSFPIVKLQSLDKITARTMTFEAKVGSTVKFGPLYIKIQACKKAPPVEQPEAAAFLQIWQVIHTPDTNLKDMRIPDKAEWVFSGWMFASSPGLSYMDHPIYDVWVLDCLDKQGQEKSGPNADAKADEGVVPENKIPVKPDLSAKPMTDIPDDH